MGIVINRADNMPTLCPVVMDNVSGIVDESLDVSIIKTVIKEN